MRTTHIIISKSQSIDIIGSIKKDNYTTKVGIASPEKITLRRAHVSQ
jgi:hypothetical protein